MESQIMASCISLNVHHNKIYV